MVEGAVAADGGIIGKLAQAVGFGTSKAADPSSDDNESSKHTPQERKLRRIVHATVKAVDAVYNETYSFNGTLHSAVLITNACSLTHTHTCT